MAQEFYKPEPVAPNENPTMRTQRAALWISVVGWIFYGCFAFAFADLAIIPPAIQSALVLLGSALIVIGAEANTIPTGILALSKIGTGRFTAWDGAAFVASIFGGLCAALITFATRQTELAGLWWRNFSIKEGPLVLGIATVLDFYGALSELAFGKRDYEADWATWWKEKCIWEAEHGVVQAPPVVQDDWPAARIEDFRRVVAGLNGYGSVLTKQRLVRELAEDELQLPAPSTVLRWFKKLKEGTL